MQIDLNADVGEGFGAFVTGADEALLEHVTSANVACGFHAGDPSVIDRTVGARQRRASRSARTPATSTCAASGAARCGCRRARSRPTCSTRWARSKPSRARTAFRSRHVKPHGALYNQAADDPELARAIARGVARVSSELVFVGLAGSQAMRHAAAAAGLRFAAEAFADRAYDARGRLVPRSQPGSVTRDPAVAAAAALRLARDGVALAIDGSEVAVEADTLCLHGDSPGAVEIARAVREALERAGVGVKALGR